MSTPLPPCLHDSLQDFWWVLGVSTLGWFLDPRPRGLEEIGGADWSLGVCILSGQCTYCDPLSSVAPLVLHLVSTGRTEYWNTICVSGVLLPVSGVYLLRVLCFTFVGLFYCLCQ